MILPSDFLHALRDGLQDELEDAGLDSSSILFTHYEAASLLDTCAFHSPVTKVREYPPSQICLVLPLT